MKDRHLLLLNGEKKKSPLFIIPGVGGKCEAFRTVANALRKECTVYGINMMGTLRGETPLRTIEEIAAQNIQWMCSFKPEGPYRIAAHSFGAFVAYEMARQMEAAGEPPDFIAVLDQSIGVIAGPPADVDRVTLVMDLVKDYFECFKIIAPPYPEWSHDMVATLETLSMEEMVPYVSDFIASKLPRMARKVEYFSRLINIRFYNRLIGYRPTDKLDTEVLILKARDHDWGKLDETLGWSSYSYHVKRIEVPGTHHNMLYGSNAAAIARCLRQRIAQSPLR